MRFDLNSALIAFRLIAIHGSFTRASAELNVSPSALSQTLRQLESYLGVRLCHRTTRKVSLTEAGTIFLAKITPSLIALAQAIDELRQSHDFASGTLRITLPRVIAMHLLAPLLAGFMQEYPHVKLELDINDSLCDIVAGGFDAGIRIGQSIEQDMIVVPFGRIQQFVVVGSPQYFAKYGQPKTPNELQEHICLCYRFMHSGAIHRWTFLESPHLSDNPTAQTIEVLPKWQLCINDHDVCVQAAMNGAGLAYVFDIEARDLINAGQLIPVLSEWMVPIHRFYLYYPNREYMPLKLRVFIDYMRENLR